MRVHPAIAALRGRPTSQRRPAPGADPRGALDAVQRNWLAAAATRVVAADLRRYAKGSALADGGALHAALTDHAKASALVQPLVQSTLHALGQHPLGEAPFRFKVSRGLSTLQILQSGRATLSLAAYEPLPHCAPETALFSDRELHEITLSGRALTALSTWSGEGLVTTRHERYGLGTARSLKPRLQSRQILKVERSLLLLQLSREPETPAPTRLVDLATGETVRIASGAKATSEAVMALSVLGALGDRSALDVMERTALNDHEDADVRWEALRQALALDPVRGIKLLDRLANRDGDDVSAPARKLSAQLLEAHPDLRASIEREVAPCP